MKLVYALSLVISVLCSSCVETYTAKMKKSNDIAQTNPETWTLEQCNYIINFYTSHNPEGFKEKFSDKSFSSCDVYIKALPLTKLTVQAISRKEAIQKRFNNIRFRELYKENLELYTNLTLDPNGFVKTKENLTGITELSFLVEFENVSRPFHNIEAFRADEGFFIENVNGEFGRVKKISGYYVDETFLLSDQLKATITYSLLSDDGKQIFSDTNQKLKLVFTSLQEKPVMLEWN